MGLYPMVGALASGLTKNQYVDLRRLATGYIEALSGTYSDGVQESLTKGYGLVTALLFETKGKSRITLSPLGSGNGYGFFGIDSNGATKLTYSGGYADISQYDVVMYAGYYSGESTLTFTID